MQEEEVVWKRFCYHAPFIYRADIPEISDPVLFKREYEFMKHFGNQRHDPDEFRRHKFPGFSPKEFIKERTATFLILFMMSFIFSFPTTIILLFRVNPSFKVAVSLGTLLNLSVEVLCKLLFGFSLYSLAFSYFH